MSSLRKLTKRRRQLLGGLAFLLLGVGFVATYSVVRYGFLATPKFLADSFPSSLFLEKTLRGKAKSIFSIAFSPDNQTLASASADGNINVWDVMTGEAIQTLQGHQSSIIPSLSVTFGPDGKLLASGSRADGTVKIWRVSR